MQCCTRCGHAGKHIEQAGRGAFPLRIVELPRQGPFHRLRPWKIKGRLLPLPSRPCSPSSPRPPVPAGAFFLSDGMQMRQRHVAVQGCFPRQQSVFLRKPRQDVGEGADLGLGGSLGWIDDEVRQAVFRHVDKRRDQRPRPQAVSRHPRVTYCNAMPRRRSGERQLEGIENEPTVCVDVRCPNAFQPAPPLLAALSGMEQGDMSKIGRRSKRCSYLAGAHRCELLGKQWNRIHTRPLAGSPNDDGIDVRRSEIRRVVGRCGDAQFCSRQGVIDVCQPRQQPTNRKRGWHPQSDDGRCLGVDVCVLNQLREDADGYGQQFASFRRQCES